MLPLLRVMIFWVTWLAFAAVPTVVAQTSADSNCTDILFKWVFNSDGQSPCRVAEILADTCDQEGFVILPLDSGATYPGPTVDENNACHCNTVLYSLMSACAACQDRSWITWTEYTQNCTASTYLSYPGQIPSDTSVPPWAYLNVTATNDTFNVSAAFIASGSATTSAAATSTSIPSNLVVTGAIIGGVGSIIGVLALFIVLTRWIFKRLEARGSADARRSLTGERIPPAMSPLPPPPTSPPPPSFPTTVYSGDPESLPPLYNPDDPATFPPEVPPISQRVSRVDPQAEYPGLPEPVESSIGVGSDAHGRPIPRRVSF